MKTTIRSGLLLIALLLPPIAQAEQKVVYDDYEVHYAAMLTSDLAPEIARAYNIPRSGKRAFLMIHVRKLLSDGTSESVAAGIEGQVSNLLGQVRQLEWQLVKEENSIYSLSHFPVTQREWANFKLIITPEATTAALPLEFKQQFYTD